LPPSLRADHARLAHALDQFPHDRLRVAVEFRHRSWFEGDRTAALLRERNVALVLTDRKSRPLEPLWRTADWGYVRFHEGTAHPWPHYGDAALDSWADRIAGCWSDGEDVYAYFNNDPGCWAVHDAVRFADHVRAHRRTPTRVPEPIEVHAG
jgi:uncharacterized protein YecE (DUF72 family)